MQALLSIHSIPLSDMTLLSNVVNFITGSLHHVSGPWLFFLVGQIFLRVVWLGVDVKMDNGQQDICLDFEIALCIRNLLNLIVRIYSRGMMRYIYDHSISIQIFNITMNKIFK